MAITDRGRIPKAGPRPPDRRCNLISCAAMSLVRQAIDWKHRRGVASGLLLPLGSEDRQPRNN